MRRRSTDKRLSSLSDHPSVLLTLAVCLACWVLCYVYSAGFPPERSEPATPLWTSGAWLYGNKLIACLSCLFIATVVAFVIQRISDVEALIRRHTRLPFMLFLLLISANAGLLSLKEVAIALLCLVFAIHDLFRTYQSSEATGRLFNTGVLTATAGLFTPPVLWFIPLLWLGMYRFRSLNFRNFMASVIGVCIVYWIVTAWCLWKHDFSMMTSIYHRLTDIKVLSTEVFQYYRTGSIVVILILVAVFFHIRIDLSGNSVRVRQMLSFLIDMSVWSFVLLLLYGNDTDSFLALLYLPSSVLITYFLENAGRVFRFVLFYFMLAVWFASFLLRLWIF